MANRRLEIHRSLCKILECETIGPECRCHFQPASNVRMVYPAIVYQLSDVIGRHADNRPYIENSIYQLTLIDRDPESKYAEAIKKLPKINFVRFFVADNMNHWVFNIY